MLMVIVNKVGCVPSIKKPMSDAWPDVLKLCRDLIEYHDHTTALIIYRDDDSHIAFESAREAVKIADALS